MCEGAHQEFINGLSSQFCVRAEVISGSKLNHMYTQTHNVDVIAPVLCTLQFVIAQGKPG